MHLGAVLPHHEIGTDPGAIKAYAQGLEELGVANLLVYDHVVGADRDRPGGFEGPYDKDVAFHEPFTVLSFIAAVTQRLELVTAVLILPQRQTVLVAKQAAELAVLSGNRLRLGIGTGWNTVEYVALERGVQQPRAASGGAGRADAPAVGRGRVRFDGEFHTVEQAGINPRPSKPIPIWFGGSAPAAARALRPPRRRLGAARLAQRVVTAAHRHHPRSPPGGGAVDGRLRHPGPGAVRRR